MGFLLQLLYVFLYSSNIHCFRDEHIFYVIYYQYLYVSGSQWGWEGRDYGRSTTECVLLWGSLGAVPGSEDSGRFISSLHYVTFTGNDTGGLFHRAGAHMHSQDSLSQLTQILMFSHEQSLCLTGLWVVAYWKHGIVYSHVFEESR